MEDFVIQRIRSVIKSERVSISALSKMINMPQVTLNRQVSGESAMSLETFVAIMNYFPKVSLDWVIRGEGDMMNDMSSPSRGKFVVYVDEDGYLKLKR